MLLLAVALAGVAGERVAAACDPLGLTGVKCSGTTPECDLGGVCVTCGQGLLLGLAGCPAGETCQTSGACAASCTRSFKAGSDAGGTPCSASTPACSAGLCYACDPSSRNDSYCGLPTPDCNSTGVCGCDDESNCGDGGHCDMTVSPGQCTNTCQPNSHSCSGATPVCGRLDGGMGECVECSTDSDCTGFQQECDVTTNLCASAFVDAGPPVADGGAAPPDAGSGIVDSGTSTADATVHDGGASVGDGSASSSGATYPPGKVEGGGCSLLTVGSSDSPASPALFGFAGLAGLFFLRRSQRRSSKRRTERR